MENQPKQPRSKRAAENLVKGGGGGGGVPEGKKRAPSRFANRKRKNKGKIGNTKWCHERVIGEGWSISGPNETTNQKVVNGAKNKKP